MEILAFGKQIHRFTVNGIHLVLDISSGAVHLLDELSWSVLEELERHSGNIAAAASCLKADWAPEGITEVIEELKDLKGQGLLGSPAEQHSFIPDYELKSLCLNVAHDCNLRCKYCFAGTGGFGGHRGLMDFKTGKAALDLLLGESKRYFCEVDFFGGEPLLNFGLVQQLVNYGNKQAALAGKEIRFTLTTNGLLLDTDAIDFLNQEQMQVVLSIDGRQKIHDAMRPGPGGGGSYQEVTAALQHFVNSREANYYIRGTYTAKNLDFSKDVIHLRDLGFTEISLEPVVAERFKEFALRDEHLPQLEAEYENLAKIYLDCLKAGHPFNFFHFNISLDRGPCLPKRMTSCGAGYQYLAVTPAGDLYPCHQFVGQKEFLLGNVWQGITRTEISDSFRRSTVEQKPSCSDCWARYYCSGGCQANAQAVNGRIDIPDELSCSLMQKRVECALYVQSCIKLLGMENGLA